MYGRGIWMPALQHFLFVDARRSVTMYPNGSPRFQFTGTGEALGQTKAQSFPRDKPPGIHWSESANRATGEIFRFAD